MLISLCWSVTSALFGVLLLLSNPGGKIVAWSMALWAAGTVVVGCLCQKVIRLYESDTEE